MLESIMHPVRLHHNALLCLDSIIGKQTVQIFQAAILYRACCHQELPALCHIIRQHILLLLGNIAGRAVYDNAGSILRNGVYGQQGESAGHPS